MMDVLPARLTKRMKNLSKKLKTLKLK